MKKGYFGKSNSDWDWEKFLSTKDFPVSEDLMDWIVGQEKAIEECKLCLDEWMHKLGWLEKKKWWKFWEKAESHKPQAKEWLPAGPFLLLLGTQGTGKSLLGRALASHLNKLYKDANVNLFDVLSWKNDVIPSEPRVSICPTPKGKSIVKALRKKEMRKRRLTKWGFRLLQGLFFGFGGFIIGVLLFYLFHNWIMNAPYAYGVPCHEWFEGNFIQYLVTSIMGNAQMFFLGLSAMSMGVMMFIFKHLLGMFGGNRKGISGAESIDSPKIIVDNSSGEAQFIDATGHTSPQLFGSVAWDPLQTGGLGTPEHQRVSAGDVHRAFMGILYIDEIKNLKGDEAVTLLTVLEDGQLAITLRNRWSSGGTSAMAVSTEPVPCMTFFVAAGNMDSVPQIHPALMDRIRGYGKIVYMNDDMPNTVENRRKYVQFISQEVSRFKLLPFSRDACIEIIEEARRNSGRKDRLTCLFRPMISIVKTASVLAINEGVDTVQTRHITEAREEHCKSIHKQVLERIVEKQDAYKIIDPEAKPKVGQIHGVAIMSFDEDRRDKMGGILPIRASVIKCKKKQQGYFNVTGVATKDDTWVQHSIAKVVHVMNQVFSKDRIQLNQEYMTHVDFAQTLGVDGPSAGVAMSLAVFSAMTGYPIRQDTVLTGEVNIGVDDEILITPIGGVHEKILAAERMGFKRVCIPKKNYDNDIRVKDYKVEIISCATLEDYIQAMLIIPKDEKGKKNDNSSSD
jgi:lon-related putative ATP-dependent protease